MAGIFGDLGSAFDWTKKHVFNPVGHAVSTGAKDVAHFVDNDVVHPVEHAASNVAHTVENAPQTFRNDVVAPVQRDFIKPVINLPHTVNQDFIKPVNRDFVQPTLHLPSTLNRDLMPGPASVTDFLKQIPSAAVKVAESPAHIPLGNGATTGSFFSQVPNATKTVIAPYLNPAKFASDFSLGEHQVANKISNLPIEEKISASPIGRTAQGFAAGLALVALATVTSFVLSTVGLLSCFTLSGFVELTVLAILVLDFV